MVISAQVNSGCKLSAHSSVRKCANSASPAVDLMKPYRAEPGRECKLYVRALGADARLPAGLPYPALAQTDKYWHNYGTVGHQRALRKWWAVVEW